MFNEARQEKFSITFDGQAFDQHEISVITLAQSLIALEYISKHAASQAYPQSKTEMKVSSGFRAGSFNVDLILECLTEQSTGIAATAGVVTIVLGIFKLVKFLKGKKPSSKKILEGGMVEVTNSQGVSNIFNHCVVNAYDSQGVRRALDKFASAMDEDGVDSISIKTTTDSQAEESESIIKSERAFFRSDDVELLSDNEDETVLEVVGPQLDGSPKNWRFLDDPEREPFTATVEDQEFLDKVASGEYVFSRGASVRAILRVVQRKGQRVSVARSVTKIKEIYSGDGNRDTRS
ncbi:MAG: hypothetical protein IJ228_00755 [Succinivibrio sp.]|nr:hypothetical protein [Succinivibrio sp.]